MHSTGADRSAVDVHARFDGFAGNDVLLLSSSLGTTLEMWDPQMEAFAREFRVLRYDRRGHGLSPVPPGPYSLDDLGGDVVRLLDREGLERVSFCGISLGGMVGMWLGAHAPDRVARLVVCCTSARIGTSEMWHERSNLVRRLGVAAVADGIRERWFTQGFRASSPEVVERVMNMVLATPSEGYAACCEALAEADMSDVLARIEAPTLVVAGASDPGNPPGNAEAIAAAVRDARVAVLEAAHLASAEVPEEFAATVLGHLRV